MDCKKFQCFVLFFYSSLEQNIFKSSISFSVLIPWDPLEFQGYIRPPSVKSESCFSPFFQKLLRLLCSSYRSAVLVLLSCPSSQEKPLLKHTRIFCTSFQTNCSTLRPKNQHDKAGWRRVKESLGIHQHPQSHSYNNGY